VAANNIPVRVKKKEAENTFVLIGKNFIYFP